VTEDRTWLTEPEKGSLLGMRLLFGVVRLAGRPAARACLSLVAFYYALFAARARRASQDYLRRLGRPAGFLAACAHLRCFAHVTLDRLFLLQGRLDRFEFERTGSHHLVELRRARRGALLVGAHVGSYEAMRAMSTDVDIHIHVLAHFANAARITRFLERASGGDPMLRVIPIDPADPTYLLRVKDLVEGGELVAVLGDRLGINDKVVAVDFLGAPAAFPAGPFVIGALLGCPVYLVFGLHHPPRRYALYCEPFAERIDLPRAERESALREYVARYAGRLEHYCRLAPHNWFNFFDFWSRPR
jgi:predicted LPLAT superfamily acyltransferase